MKTRVFLITLVLLASLVVLYLFEAERSDSQLLDEMSLLQPGLRLEAVKTRLGHQMYALNSIEDVRHYGPIQDVSFCRGKKLYIFEVGKFPATALDVYTDGQDTVVFVSWHRL